MNADAVEAMRPGRVMLAPYLLIPLVLSGLWGPIDSVGAFAWQYLEIFLVTTAVAGSVQLSLVFALPKLGGLRPLAFWIAMTAIVIASTIVGSELGSQAMALVSEYEVAQVRSGILRVALVVALVMTMISATVHTLTAEIRYAERAALQAELRALQARTDPHFLFNSLNTVAALIEEDPVKAVDVLERFSDLFRYALEGDGPTVPLREEVRAVTDYLRVEEMRLAERLAYDITIDADCEEVLVPRFMLQPLVENAVRHGIAPRTSGGHIEVRATGEADHIVVEVSDDGGGDGTATAGNGVALQELTQRLKLLYGDKGRLKTEGSAAGFRVSVRIPR